MTTIRILRNTVWLLLGAALVTSCSKDDTEPVGPEGIPVAVEFGSGHIAASRTTTTPAGETLWSQGDEIGVFMIKSGQALNNTDIPEGADNIAYKAQTDGSDQSGFTPTNTGETIYYPQDGSSVDFIAYYPYKPTGTGTGEITGYLYPVNVSDQSDASKIDVLYSNDATGYNKKSGTVDLPFAHALSKLTLNVTSGTGAPDLTGLTVTLGGQYDRGSLSLSDGTTFGNLQKGDIAMRTVAAAATYEAILIPQGTVAGSKATFMAGSDSYQWDLSAVDLLPGYHYTYAVTVNKTGVTVTASDITYWTGAADTPVEGVGNNFYQVGDYYPANSSTAIGVVFWVDPSDSHHGKAVGLTEINKVAWSDSHDRTGTTDQNNGRVNMRTIYNLSNDFSGYPAFAWVHSQNPAGADYSDPSVKNIWYLPAPDELRDLYNAKDAVNTALTSTGGTALNPVWYWSSSEGDLNVAIVVEFGRGITIINGKNSYDGARCVLAF